MRQKVSKVRVQLEVKTYTIKGTDRFDHRDVLHNTFHY